MKIIDMDNYEEEMKNYYIKKGLYGELFDVVHGKLYNEWYGDIHDETLHIL